VALSVVPFSVPLSDNCSRLLKPCLLESANCNLSRRSGSVKLGREGSRAWLCMTDWVDAWSSRRQPKSIHRKSVQRKLGPRIAATHTVPRVGSRERLDYCGGASSDTYRYTSTRTSRLPSHPSWRTLADQINSASIVSSSKDTAHKTGPHSG